MIRIGSLFSGIGGLERGLEAAFSEAGIPAHVVWQVEREPFPRAVLAKHWPDADRSVIDVCKAGSANLATVDLICGGFPCQDISSAGNGRGLRGSRSGLWREFCRIIGEVQPRIAIVENVASRADLWLPFVLEDIAALGYRSRSAEIRASDVGAPHKRTRIFVVAYAHERGRESFRDYGQLDERERAQFGDYVDGCGGKEGGEIGGRNAFEPEVGRVPHGVPDWVVRDRDGTVGNVRWPSARGVPQHRWEPPRSAWSGSVADHQDALAALGNAVVPAVAREIGRWLLSWCLDASP